MILQKILKAKAERGIAIVKACRDNFEDKARYLRDELGVIAMQISLNNERLINTSDEEVDVLVELDRRLKLDEVKQLQKQKQFQKYRSTLDLMEKLLYTIEVFYIDENYWQIIKSVHGKQLPKLVKDSGRISEVYEMALQMLRNLNLSIEEFETTEIIASKAEDYELSISEICDDLHNPQKKKEESALQRKHNLQTQSIVKEKFNNNKKANLVNNS